MNAQELKLAKAIGKVVLLGGHYDAQNYWADDGIINPNARYGERGDRYGVEVEIAPYQKYALPSDEDGIKAVVTMSTMYGGLELTMELLELIAEVSGSRKINVGDNEQMSSGCDTCGHNGRYELTVTILDPKVD